MVAAPGHQRVAPLPLVRGKARGRLLTIAVALALLALFLAFANEAFNAYRVQLVTLVAIKLFDFRNDEMST